MAKKINRSGMGRRSFLTGAMATAVTIIKPGLVRGAKANSTVEVGLIGCGGRGGWMGGLFRNHGGYKWVACADYFPERAQGFAKAHKIPEANCHSSLSGYKKLLDTWLPEEGSAFVTTKENWTRQIDKAYRSYQISHEALVAVADPIIQGDFLMETNHIKYWKVKNLAGELRSLIADLKQRLKTLR